MSNGIPNKVINPKDEITKPYQIEESGLEWSSHHKAYCYSNTRATSTPLYVGGEAKPYEEFNDEPTRKIEYGFELEEEK